MKTTYSLEIEAPPERVFEWLGHAQRALEWVPNLVESEDVDVTPSKIGSTFRHAYLERGRRMEMHGKVTGYEPNRRLTIEMQGEAFDLWVDYRAEDLGGRTRLTQESEVKFKSLAMRIVAALMRPLIAKAARQQQAESFAKLKRLAEAR
jgi:uncharacterized protein YndB with AHSA1/START domain